MTITAGNVGIDHCLANAKNLLNAFGRSDVPVYIGSAFPITKWSFGDDKAALSHGENGLALKIQDYLQQLPKPVSEFGKTLADLYNGLRGLTTPVNYIVTGPCTTLALLIKVFPDVMEKIKRIIIMGGSFSVGNITPYAEFNIRYDPESYQVLLGCPLEKIVFGMEPLRMLGYDLAFIETIRKNRSSLGWLIGECYQQVYTSYLKRMKE